MERFHPPADVTPRLNEYFIAGDGIDKEVIMAGITRYLGNDATVRPGTYESRDGTLIQGYFFIAYRSLTSAMVEDLKADSARWEAERREPQRREQVVREQVARELELRRALQLPAAGLAEAPTGSQEVLPDQLEHLPLLEDQPNDPQTSYTGHSQSELPPGAATDSGYASMPQDSSKTTASVPRIEPNVTGASDLTDHVSVADDAATIYSAAQGLDERQVNVYKSELADHLCKQVRTLCTDVETQKHIVDLLPNLLKNFALRLGQHASSRSENEVMYFIHKYRVLVRQPGDPRNAKLTISSDITRRFREALFETTEEDFSLPLPEPIAQEDLEQNVQSWLYEVMDAPERTAARAESVSRDVDDPDTSWEDMPEAHDMEPLIVPDEQRYREIAFRSPAFEWLLSSLGSASNLRPSDPNDAISRVRHKVIGAFPRSHAVSSRSPSTVYTMKFNCLWDIHRFLHHEYPELQGGRARLGNVITVTGSPADAQALSCAGYLEQTWPFTGLDVLTLLQEAVDKDGWPVFRELPDRTRITIRVQKDNRSLSVDVQGTVDAIAEIGEQIGWITTALSSGPTTSTQEALMYCSPTITDITEHEGTKVAYIDHLDCSTPDQQDFDGISSSNGICWRTMFRNPVVVAGYPIRRRPKDGTGLEIPLNMMAGLVRSDRLCHFLGKSFIKGFSSMLVAIHQVGSTYIWHHHHGNHQGNRVSYIDADATSIGYASLHELATARHIVGWCTEADSHAGSPYLNYNIKSSGLPQAGHDFALEKVSLSCGQIITGGCQFGIGRKDIPIHISKVGYIDRLRWISQKYVVFWDVDDERGWMVNGSDALLHLLRGSLEHSRTDKFCSRFLFDFSKLKTGSAIDILVDQEHRRLPVYPAREETYTETTTSTLGVVEEVTKTKTTFTTLGDKIDELYEYVEKMIDHKSQVENPKGFNAKVRLRRYLEGWDFRDITAGRDPFHLRVATLPTSAFSWVELTRAAQAITIFGKQFGELVTPSNRSTKTACSSWRSVPRGRHYLCISLDDIKRIIDDAGGDVTKSPVLISPKLSWVNPSRACPFAECVCAEWRSGANLTVSPLTRHADPIQQLIPTCLPLGLQRAMSKGPLNLEHYGDGAVIFGQVFGFSWKWPEIDESEARTETGGGNGRTTSFLRQQTGSSSSFSETPPTGNANSDNSSSRSRTGASSSSNPVTTFTSASSQSESMQIPPPHERPPPLGAKRPLMRTDDKVADADEDLRKRSRMRRHLAFRRP